MNKKPRARRGRKKTAYGKHLILDAYGIDEKKLRNRSALLKLLTRLPKKLKMRIVGKPAVLKVSSTIPRYPDWGLSGFAVLLESHISFHTWPKEGFVAMDLYSCKDFNHKDTVKYLNDYWLPRKMRIQIVNRG